METNRPDPPCGVRGQLNGRFEQHTIGYLRSAPMRHWESDRVRARGFLAAAERHAEMLRRTNAPAILQWSHEAHIEELRREAEGE